MPPMAALILDLIVVAVFIITVLLAYRRGFLASVVQLGGYLISIAASLALCKWIAPMIFQAAIRPGIVDKINTELSAAITPDQLSLALEQLSHKIPEFLNNLLFEGKTMMELVGGNLGEGSEVIASQITDQFIGPAIILLLEFLLFVVFFILCRLLVRLLVKILIGVNHIPVIGTLNGLLGSLVGVGQAVIYLVLLAIILHIVIVLSNNGIGWMNQQTIDQSYLFVLFDRINPFRLL